MQGAFHERERLVKNHLIPRNTIQVRNSTAWGRAEKSEIPQNRKYHKKEEKSRQIFY